MEMDGCAVVLKFVVHLDDNGITPAGFNWRAWQLAVDQHNKSLYTIGGCCCVGDVEFVGDYITSDGSVLVPVGVDIEATVFVGARLARASDTVW